MRRIAATAALLLALGACNQRGPEGLTDDERDRLNQIAAEQDSQGGIDIIDASPDSLVANEALQEEPEAQPASNAVAANGH